MHTHAQQDGPEPEEVSYDTWMLNLRFILIALVFIATGIEPVMDRFGMLGDLHTWIFMFHMPLFAYVTGYFSRHNLLGRKGVGPLIMITVQYFIFQTLYSSLDVLYFHASQQEHSFFVPYLMLWFLIAHLGWRLLLRLMCALGIKHPVLLSVCLGVLAGYLGSNGSWLSLSRLFVFLPFFAAGYAIHPEKVRAVCRGKGRVIQGSLSLLLLVATVLFAWQGTPGWLYGKFTYAEMGAGGFAAAFARIGWYLLQVAASLAFLALIPHKRSVLTNLGSRTLYVFLLHGLFVRSGISLGLYDYIRQPADLIVLAVCILSMTVLLALPQTRQYTGWLIEPELSGFSKLGQRLVFHRHRHHPGVLKKL